MPFKRTLEAKQNKWQTHLTLDQLALKKQGTTDLLCFTWDTDLKLGRFVDKNHSLMRGLRDPQNPPMLLSPGALLASPPLVTQTGTRPKTPGTSSACHPFII